jgi:hypothetical protein
MEEAGIFERTRAALTGATERLTALYEEASMFLYPNCSEGFMCW